MPPTNNNVPTPGQQAAIKRISTLLDPACALVATVRNDGYVVLSASLKKDAMYTYTDIGSAQAGGVAIPFEFGVDVQSEEKPLSGLLVERTGDWMQPWDDEVAYVVGGEAFPFGSDPAPMAGRTNPDVQPLAKVKGTVAMSSDGGSCVITIESTSAGGNRVSISKLTKLGTDSSMRRSLSLWLPEGTQGYLTFAGKTYRSSDFS